MVGRKKLEGPGVNYFELPRRQLQSMCKKYGFPANRTNQLMAEFLTSHLNSDEYLNRDKSLPSPSVKTIFQCRDEEPAIDDNLSTISESQQTVAETAVRSLSQEFMNLDATSTDSPLESSKEEETGFGDATQNGSEDMAGGSPLEEAKDFTTSCFRIRGYKSKSVQDTLLPSTTEAQSMDCEREGSSRGSLAVSDHPSSSEEGMDVTTIDFGTRNSPPESENPLGQETPLPLSTMPYVRPFTPDSTLSHNGLKLIIDLENDNGLPSVENMTYYYGAWGAQIPSRTNTTVADECTLGSLKTSEGSEISRPILESHRDNGLTTTDRAAEEGELKNLLLQASIASKETDAAPLKSCLVTPNRKAFAPTVSFLCPEPIFSSPRSINGLISDAAERSGIVKEWSSAEQSQETFERIDEEKAANGELLLQKVDVKLIARETSELILRSPKSTADLGSTPHEGIVEKLVKICEDRSPSTVQSASQRKDSYKASPFLNPFLKSSRIAAELERASKLGQTRRVGILALKRAMGVAPLFSDSPDVEKEPPVSDSCTDGICGSDDKTFGSPVLSPGSKPIQVDGIQETGVSHNDMDRETQTPRSAEVPVAGGALQNKSTLQSVKDIVDNGEQIIGQMEIDCHKPEESEVLVAEEAVNLPATVEEPSNQLETVDYSSPQTEEGESIVEDNTSKESSCEALIHDGTMSIATADQELNVHEEPVTTESVSEAWEDSSKSKENATEKPAAALSFLDIDFTKIRVENVAEVPLPKTILEICPDIRERIAAERSTPLSPLDNNRLGIDAVVGILQNPTTPTKPSSILDILSESGEKNGISSYNKENEWSRRLEQHKTPLTGRSKEKALRTAEKKASTLREQLLRKRRGLMEGVTDSEDPLVQLIELSPVKELATNRML